VLARLALSAVYREAADFTAGAYRPSAMSTATPWDYVDHTARAVAMAQDVLARAVVYARERGGSWTTIAEALAISAEQAPRAVPATVDRWEDALDRPWERSGRFLASRMPDGMVSANLPHHRDHLAGTGRRAAVAPDC
jgi:hypothetical protein